MQIRDEWLDEFKQASAEFRAKRAEKFRADARHAARDRSRYERELTRRVRGAPEQGHLLEAFTDKQLNDCVDAAARRIERCKRRERGQLQRVEVVRACGSKALRQLCEGCAHPVVPDKALECGHVRICLSCRGSVARRRRKDFRWGRHAFLRSKAASILRRPTAPGGPWNDKFVTLTVPHSGEPWADVRELANAWKKFRRILCRMLHVELGVPDHLLRFPFVRVQEITPSDGGHAHYHLWAFLPYIPQAVLSVMWARSLSAPYQARLPVVEVADVLSRESDARSRALLERTFRTRRGALGRALGSVRMVRIDIRAGRNAEKELIKYLVKDAERDRTGKLTFVPADVFAKLYAALEGRRLIQTSEGFWVDPPAVERWCEKCGFVHDAGHRPTRRVVDVEPTLVKRVG